MPNDTKKINTVTIIDTETTGFDADKDHLIEVAVAQYDIQNASLMRCNSILVFDDVVTPGEIQSTYFVHGIPPDSVRMDGVIHARAEEMVMDYILKADAVVAHGADFDKQWFESEEILNARWICSKDDIRWPNKSPTNSLTAIALAHGLGVSWAHRAIADVLILVQLLDRVSEYTGLPELFADAMVPKKKYEAIVSYADRDKAKTAGFQWDGPSKRWWKKLREDETDGLGFLIKELDD